LSLIDDLTADAIERMKADGFEPAVVVETSPNNFQAWLNHGQVLEATMSTRAAKHLAERFGGDPASTDWRHFGRLVGFTNPKPERQLPSGMRPFARLRSAKGRVYSQAATTDRSWRKNATRISCSNSSSNTSTRASERLSSNC
jgi:RepB DNA-primase from phage plasmid